MKLNIKAFAIANAIVVAALFSICTLFVVLAPEAFYAFNKSLFHIDLAGIGRSASRGGFFAGLVVLALSAGIAGAAWAWLYNRLARGRWRRIQTLEDDF